MAHVHITNDRDHKVFAFIRDRLADTAAFVNSTDDENDEIQFAAKLDGVKLEAKLRQYWPPAETPHGKLVGSVDIYMSEIPSNSATPTTHEDLFDIYHTRAREHGFGFLLAGEIDEAANVLIDGEPALDQSKFKLRFPTGEGVTVTDAKTGKGYIELEVDAWQLPRFGCEVAFYAARGTPTSRSVIEAAFIELLDGAVPSGEQ